MTNTPPKDSRSSAWPSRRTSRRCRSFIEKTPLNWPVGINEDVAVKYGTYGLPDNYLFLPDGMMTKHFIGYTKEEALEPLIQAGLARIPQPAPAPKSPGKWSPGPRAKPRRIKSPV